MRQATINDYPFFCLVAEECGIEPITIDRMEATLGFVGEYGYFIIDMQDEHGGIIHTAILPDGRGRWARDFFAAFIRWAFTHTRLERLSAAIPVRAKNVRRFALDAGMRIVHVTDMYVFMDIDILRWMSFDRNCARSLNTVTSDYLFADREMSGRVAEACSMMHEAGMEHKAWYTYTLYAKLFGYTVEA